MDPRYPSHFFGNDRQHQALENLEGGIVRNTNVKARPPEGDRFEESQESFAFHDQQIVVSVGKEPQTDDTIPLRGQVFRKDSKAKIGHHLGSCLECVFGAVGTEMCHHPAPESIAARKYLFESFFQEAFLVLGQIRLIQLPQKGLFSEALVEVFESLAIPNDGLVDIKSLRPQKAQPEFWCPDVIRFEAQHGPNVRSFLHGWDLRIDLDLKETQGLGKKRRVFRSSAGLYTV